ncbi:glucosamine-6-phosphate deaminase [Spiroplasma platyhelix]|uniref:Glucosamine-6-phosphate deaminase n=1 Tax=Spiroplasma platyhelix PALS-1 TaxID=1276218 RepID=A0A846U1N8_9MOLU|nr:glucosamine-6-phosphate deaminase [Spiroplasma platyhelix]MBE4704344.1 Glucosamine-6-phosphate deaminase 1 [Spiroplasma platyhelix PALS-1]NKE38716.1 glucosamine-6-phosphate deaminase [Spiroplasma platyhelix PALS-1]UJB28926.1 glucosamine-6-phosphate deaminase [Spiroplasma platyhelix PALS-1]
MHLIVTKDSDEIANLLSKIVIGLVNQKSNAVLGLATGSSPIATYKLLIEDHQTNKTDWSNVSTFNLDEYVGLQQENHNSYHYFMEEQLFKHLNIKKANIHIPNGLGDVKQNATEYEKLISEHQQIDFQILGIGSNGHIGFNEPGSDVKSVTRVVELSKETIQANKRFFASSQDTVPTQAITMGIATILKAKNIVLIATGKNKAEAVKALVQGKVSEKWPCSYLQNHPSVLILADQAAASLLEQKS